MNKTHALTGSEPESPMLLCSGRHAATGMAIPRRMFMTLLVIGIGAASAGAQGGCPAGWMPGIGTPGTNGNVKTLACTAQGEIVVGGSFSTAGDVAASNIARFNPATNLWSTIGDAGAGTNGDVNAVVCLPDGDLIIGGSFSRVGGVSVTNIARYHATTSTTGNWQSIGDVLGAVLSLSVLPDGDVLVGGFFPLAGGIAATNIACYNPTANSWSALGEIGAGVNGSVAAMLTMADGDVLIGGAFSQAGSLGGQGSIVAAANIVRYHPESTTAGTWSGIGTGADSYVFALATLPGGDVIVGGNFQTVGGISSSRLARYRPTTDRWAGISAGTDATVYALAVLPGGDLVVGGAFSQPDGVNTNYVGRYSPAFNSWRSVGGGADDWVHAVLVLPDGDVVAGGYFTNTGEGAANFIARYSPGAAKPRIVGQTLPVVTAPGGTAMFGVSAILESEWLGANYQWRRDGVALNTSINPSAGTAVLTLTNVQGADLGSYDCVVTNACGGTGVVSNAADLTFQACSGDFNGDGSVDFFDYLDFVNAYSIGC